MHHSPTIVMYIATLQASTSTLLPYHAMTWARASAATYDAIRFARADLAMQVKRLRTLHPYPE